MRNNDIQKNYISLGKLIEADVFKIDKGNIYQTFSDYINCVNPHKRCNNFFPACARENGVYGICIYEYISKYLALVKEQTQLLTYQGFHALYEHKVIMVDRLKHFEERGILPESVGLSQKYLPVMELAEAIRFLTLKYNATKKLNIIDNITSKLNDIYEIEKDIFNQILESIR